jgi:hypothetical protein
VTLNCTLTTAASASAPRTRNLYLPAHIRMRLRLPGNGFGRSPFRNARLECRIAVSPPMLQKSTNSWKLLPIPPMEPDSQGKTTQYSEAKQVKTLINYHHASAHRDTMQVWLPEMGLPPPGALRMQSSGHSPHGRDAAPMAHGHSMSAVVWLLKRSFSALGATQPAKVLLRTLAYRRQRKQQRKGCARMPPPGCPAHGHRWGARC